MKSMNLSAERLALFEKLHEAEGEVVRHGLNFTPPELADKETLREYRCWRHWNKEVPRNREISQWLKEKWAREEAAAQKSE